MHRGLVAAAVVGVMVLAFAAAGASGGSATASTGTAADATTATTGAPGATLQEDVDPDDVLMAIAVEPDGEATWTIEYRMRLETDEDEQAFEDLRRDIENDSAPYERRFHDRMNTTAENAAEFTGREMTITEMRVTAERRELPREYGVVTYRFRWSGFAAVDGDRVRAGGAIDGLFLDEDTTLRVAWTTGLALVDASPTPDETRERAVVWTGPNSFGGGQPRVELGPPGGIPSGGLAGTLPHSSLALATLVLLAVAGAGAAGVGYYRRRNTGTEPGSADSSGDAVSTAAAAGGARGPGPDDESDQSLLSNEEQVLGLIERNGGRMKQKAVAEELGWTDAKTSQVTKRLRDDGDLEGFRLGRENVLALPGERDGESGGGTGADGGDGGDGSDGDSNGDGGDGGR